MQAQARQRMTRQRKTSTTQDKHNIIPHTLNKKHIAATHLSTASRV